MTQSVVRSDRNSDKMGQGEKYVSNYALKSSFHYFSLRMLLERTFFSDGFEARS
jgi:hypothetical protein